jgi:hypothetical protein
MKTVFSFDIRYIFEIMSAITNRDTFFDSWKIYGTKHVIPNKQDLEVQKMLIFIMIFGESKLLS